MSKKTAKVSKSTGLDFRSLTAKQKMFCEEYIVDLNATQAAKRAGYKEKSARVIAAQNLSKLNIQEYIAELKKKRVDRVRIDQDYVLNGIQNTIERCMQSRPVQTMKGEPLMTETPDGGLAHAYKFDASNALRGYELLGKHQGMFTDKLELAGDGPTMSVVIKPV